MTQHRTTQPLNRTDPERLRIIVQRELSAVAHIHGDLSLEEIDRRFYAALRWFRWRRRAGHPDRH